MAARRLFWGLLPERMEAEPAARPQSRVSQWWLQWPFLLVAAPLLLGRDQQPPAHAVGLGLLVAQQLVRGLDPEERRRRFDMDVAWPVAGLTLMVVLGFLAAPNPEALRVDPLFGFLVSASAFSATVSSLRTRGIRVGRARRLWAAVAIYAGLGLPVAVALYLMMERRDTDWAVVHSLVDARPELPREVRRALRNFVHDATHPNRVGGILLFFLPLYVALLAYRPWAHLDRFRPASARAPGALAMSKLCLAGVAMSLTVGMVLLLATVSRTAFIAAGLGALFVACCRWRRVRVAVAAGAVLVVGCGLLFVVAGSSSEQDASWTPDALDRLGWALQFGRVTFEPWENLRYRVQLWLQVWPVILDHPWSGVGPGVLSPYYGAVRTHAHNLFLQTALDAGIPGLAFLVALIVLAVRQLARAVRGYRTLSDQCLAVGLAGALVAHLSWSLHDILGIGLRLGVLFWVLLALAVCLPSPAGRRASASDADPAIDPLGSSAVAAPTASAPVSRSASPTAPPVR